MITMEAEAVTQTEACRVAGNWIDQPGVSHKDKFLIKQGTALMEANEDEAARIKAAFPERWEKWDASFDEYGKVLPGEGE